MISFELLKKDIYKSVKEIWNRLVESKDIYLDKYSGWYSVSDEAFYDEDEVEEINGKKFQNYLVQALNG